MIGFRQNLGFAGVYNRGVASIEDEFALFLNNDLEVDENRLVAGTSMLATNDVSPLSANVKKQVEGRSPA